jgi:hypothetical protein
MMVPMLKLHPFSVDVLVVSIVNGANVDADLLVVFDIVLFQTCGSMM